MKNKIAQKIAMIELENIKYHEDRLNNSFEQAAIVVELAKELNVEPKLFEDSDMDNYNCEFCSLYGVETDMCEHCNSAMYFDRIK